MNRNVEMFFQSKVEDIVNFKRRLKKLVDDAPDNYVFVQYGLQHSYTLYVPKPIRCCLHSVTSGANSIVVQFLAGANNRLRSWTEDQEQTRARRTAADGKLTYRILKIIHIPSHFMYVAACADLTLKTYGSHYHEQSSTELLYTALDLVYCEFLDVVLISGIGFMQVFGFRKGLIEAPTFLADIKLPLYQGHRRWIKQISLDSKNKEILAVSYEGVLFLGGQSGQSLSCLKELENRHSMSLSAAVAYPNRNYVITGAKDGSIKAWNTMMHRFPLFGSFQGHTKEILQLVLHWTQPLLFSSATDETIRIWNIDTFSEAYRFNAMEPVISFKLLGPSSLLYTSDRTIRVWEINLFYNMFSTIDAQARQLCRVSGKGLPARIVYLGLDDAVRLVSPVHGTILNMMFPIMDHRLVDVLHDPRAKQIYVIMGDGNVMVFSSETNPCSAIQLWHATDEDDQICSIEKLESAILGNNNIESCCSLVFVGHVSGYISLLKGEGFNFAPLKAHIGSVTVLKAREYNKTNPVTPHAQLISYASDHIVLVWTISIGEVDDSNNHELEFVLHMHIEMRHEPVEMLICGDVLVLRTRKLLYYHKLRELQDGGKKITFNQADLTNNSVIQDHNGKITHICSCESLQIIAACTSDRYVRLWDTENNLIRELSFDHDIEEICFANDRGDLLIALQGNLYHVPAWNCLNRSYMMKLLEMDLADDVNEKSISFDPMLEFWYDKRWVQPIQIPRTTEHEGVKIPSDLSDENAKQIQITDSYFPSPVTLWRETYTRLRSVLTIASPEDKRLSITRATMPKLNLRSTAVYQMAANAFMKNIKRHENLMDRSCVIEESEEIELNSIEEELVDEDTLEEEVNDDNDMKEELAGDSKFFWPCAPDGYVPNSIVRDLIKPVKPPDYSALIRELEANQANERFLKALIDIAKLPKLVQSDETIPESPDEMAYYGSVTDTEAGSELGPERSVRGSVYSFAKKGRDSSLPELDDLLEKRRQKSARSKTPKGRQLMSVTIQAPTVIESRKLSKKETVESVITPEPQSKVSEIEKQKTIEERLPPVFKSHFNKSWFPKDREMESGEIVTTLLDELKETDAIAARDIFSLLLDVKRHMDMTTPVLDAVFDKLQDLMRRCNVPAIKHGAMKTMIKFAHMCREDVRRRRAQDELEFRAKKQSRLGYSGEGSKFEMASRRSNRAAASAEQREQEDEREKGEWGEHFEAQGYEKGAGSGKGSPGIQYEAQEYEVEVGSKKRSPDGYVKAEISGQEDGSKKGSPDGQFEEQGFGREDAGKEGSPGGRSLGDKYEQEDGSKTGSPDGHSEVAGYKQEDGHKTGSPDRHSEAQGNEREDGTEIEKQDEHVEEGQKRESGDKGTRDGHFKEGTRDIHFERAGYKREHTRDLTRYGYLEEGYKFEDGSQRKNREAYFKEGRERTEEGMDRVGHLIKEGYKRGDRSTNRSEDGYSEAERFEQEHGLKKASPDGRFKEEGYDREDGSKTGSPGGHSEAEGYEVEDGSKTGSPGGYSVAEGYEREDGSKAGSPGRHSKAESYVQGDGNKAESPDEDFMKERHEQECRNKEGSPVRHSRAEIHKREDVDKGSRCGLVRDEGYRRVESNRKINRYGYLEEGYKFEDGSKRRSREAYFKEEREQGDINEKGIGSRISDAEGHQQGDRNKIGPGGDRLDEEGYEGEDGNKKRSPDGYFEGEGHGREGGSQKGSPDGHFEGQGYEQRDGHRSETPGGIQSENQGELDEESQHIFDRVDLAVMELIHLLNDPITIVREEAKEGLESLAGINNYQTLFEFVQQKAFLKDDCPVDHSKDCTNDLERGMSKDTHREDSALTQEMIKEWVQSVKSLLPEAGDITEWMQSANSLLIEEEEIIEQIPEEKTDVALSSDENVMESQRISKGKMAKAAMTSIAPSLANKYQLFKGQNDASDDTLKGSKQGKGLESQTDSASSENEETNRQELENGITTENGAAGEFGAAESPHSTPAGVSKLGVLSGLSMHEKFFSRHRIKPAKRSIRIPKEAPEETTCLSSEKKAELIGLLIDVSARSLMLRRAGGNKHIPNDSTLKKISYLLDLLNQDDPKLARIADDVIALMKKLRRKLKTADETYERCFQPVDMAQVVGERGESINRFVGSEGRLVSTGTGDRLTSSGDNAVVSGDRSSGSKDRFEDHFVGSKDRLVASKDDFVGSGDRVLGSKDGSVPSGDHTVDTGDRFASLEFIIIDSKTRFVSSKDRLAGLGDHFASPEYHFADLKDRFTGAKAGAKDLFTGAEDRFTGAEDRFTGAGDRFTGAEDRFTGTEDRFTVAEHCVTGAEDRFSSPEYRFVDSNDRFVSPEDRFVDSNEHIVSPADRFVGSQDRLLGSKDRFVGSVDHVVGSGDRLVGSKDHLVSPEDRLVGLKDRFLGPGYPFVDASVAQPVSMKSVKHGLRQRCLIPSPLRRTMVSGIRGERIARTVELPVSDSKRDSDSEKQHRIKGMPERLGNCTASTTGTCHFGKMKVSWTSKAPVYDLDLTALNDNRIRSFKLQGVPRQSKQPSFTKCPPLESPLLPSLFKQRLNVEARQMNREINRKNLGMRNVVRLPRLRTEFQGRSRTDSTSNLCFEEPSCEKSPALANPPPPPNTAENLFEFAKWMKS